MKSNQKSASRGWTPTFMGVAAFLLIALLGSALAATPDNAAVEKVQVIKDDQGQKLQVAGRDFMVFGMNWGYMPIGENYTYDFWGKPDEFIKSVLATEMPMLQAMGVNVIRQYVGIPPRWVEYIWENYGIYTALNHAVARYGYTLDGVWLPNTDYSNPKLREAVKAEVFALVEEFKDTPGIIMWLLGNENNYGLTWSSFEIENLPEGEQNAAKARYLYSLMGEIIDGIKERDTLRPTCMANGDVQYIDIIAEECKNLDIFGTNQYRGISVRDMNDVVKQKMNIPLVYTEFGADAFNAREMREDQRTQAKYLIGQWQEIYERSYGKGGVGNAIGGMVFQWADGWWKFRQEERLNIHDTNASWANSAYPEDFVEGENNMNEEWWGICAKTPPDMYGYFDVHPRAAYYALTECFALDPYAPDTDLAKIREHYSGISAGYAVLEAKGAKAAMQSSLQEKVRLAGLRMEFETYNTGGTNITTPDVPEGSGEYPSFMGYDHMQSFYADFEAKPSENVQGRLSLNILGNVPDNPIDEIFYENRGRSRIIEADGQEYTYDAIDRVKVYKATINWDDKMFELNAFYREGHLHWGHEGDFFGLYRNAYYGENLDIYNGIAPIGFEISGKKSLNGLKMAAGPQLWWGANPAVFLKYQRKIGKFDVTGIFQEDIAYQGEDVIGLPGSANSSNAIPTPEDRKASIQAVHKRGNLTFEGGVLWAGSEKKGDGFQLYDDETSDEVVLRQDTIKSDDAWGFKGKVSLEKGSFRWYAQGAYMGLVANAGPTEVITFTDWNLTDSGSGNQKNVMSGFTYNKGSWQFGPNFLWQKPIVGPIPGDVDDPGRPRNQRDDPFAVIWNRETKGAELLLVFDPHPETWFWMWDNDRREGAPLAGSLGLIYKDMPTTRDAKLFFSEEGAIYAFPGASPGHTEWELNAKIKGKLGPRTRLVAEVYAGQAEPNGWVYDDSDPELAARVNRIIHRYGASARLVHQNWSLAGFLKLNDWNIYDYHRDWNFTYPLQLMGDVSFSLGDPRWFDEPETRIGIRMLYRTLDKYSNRYPEELIPDDDAPNGSEWEIRSYLHLAI